MIDMIFYVTKNDIWKRLNYVACLKESNLASKNQITSYEIKRSFIFTNSPYQLLFYSSSISSSRILNRSISFCRCMLSSKHGIVIILNLSNFIFPQFWPEIVEKGSILNIAILSNKKFLKTCSCPFVQYFCTLFWDDITIIWNESIVYFINWEKKPCLDQ